MSKSQKYLVTIGTFDGVHSGHRKLLRWVLSEARANGMKTRVVFFVVPPHFHFRPDHAVGLLTNSRDRKAIVRSLGVDKVTVLRFGPRWARMPHTRFFEEFVVRRWRAGGVLVGRDFAFGAGRRGDLDFLRGVCRSRGMSVGVLPLVRVQGRKISSSRIRKLLLKGDAERAALLLGRPHSVPGRVIRGNGLGRTLGFPTANLRVSPELLLPPGVFEVRVTGGPFRGPGGRAALCNVGRRPTVGSRLKRPAVEVHVPGWKGDLYGKALRVEFLRRLRPERKFRNIASLKAAIRKDILSVAAPA